MPPIFFEWTLTRGVLTALAWSILVLAAFCLTLLLSALALRIRNLLMARRWARYEGAWEPAVFEVMAGGDPAPLIAQVRPRDAPYFVGFLARVGRQVRGVELERLALLAAPFLSHPRAAAQTGSPEERARAVAALGLLGGAGEAALVVKALDDPEPLVAMSAARALTRQRDPAHAGALVRRLDRLDHWRPSFLAAMLAALGRDAAPALRLALQDPTLPARTRAVAAEALLRLSDPESASIAVRVAGETDDPEILTALLRLLERVGGPDALPVIRRLAAADSEAVRVAAFQGLEQLAEEEDLPLLERGLGDPSPWVAIHAARALARGPGRRLLAGRAVETGTDDVLVREALAEGVR